MKGYGFLTVLYLFICLFITKAMYRPARLIRLPVFMRNSKSIFFGKGLTTGVGCRIDAIKSDGNEGVICIGKNVQINDYCHIASAKEVVIEDDVLIASKVFITDHDHGVPDELCSTSKLRYADQPLITKEVKISRNVWLGEGVVVLKGVSIGENTVVGANSVVSKSLPANAICAGVPARVIKTIKTI